ncbi:UBE2Q2 [Branchiostoma lanceolatum]|uniref:Maturin n=1 Tax=Branchiostoma lanceolatum TaxID=7740 RepID=A0A8K0A6T6_BRALA|nr:UBE2Q2 [Branchiostoma lanceolatum]
MMKYDRPITTFESPTRIKTSRLSSKSSFQNLPKHRPNLTPMDFDTCRLVAESWADSVDCPFRLLFADEAEKRMFFSAPRNETVSFYVVCPDCETENKWHVWSDSDTSLPCLADVQDFAQSCQQKSLVDVLNRTSKALKPLLGGPVDDNQDEGLEDDDDVDEDDEEDDDEDDDDQEYYTMDDPDAAPDTTPTSCSTCVAQNSEEEEEDGGVEESSYKTSGASSVAIHRLIMDLKNMKKTKGKFGVEGVPRGDNLFLWDVKLTNIDPNCPLGKDLQQYAKQHQEEPVIKMEMKFPPDYPMAPPFVRVLKPRFKFLTGHVTIGGSICMEMLTRSGWRPTNDIESILVQIRAEILSDNNVRLDKNPNWEYTESEAKTAFHRMVNRYGWE